MRSSLDVLRSAKKYIADFVLPDYEVRLSSEEGAWERPFCRVAFSTPTALRPVGARDLECRRTLEIVAWPVESASPDAGRLAAEALVEQLTLAFAFGLHTPSYVPDRGRAHPMRFPIWDYGGKGLLDAADDTDREPTDFARVIEEPSVGDITDPNTDLSRLVVADLRIAWTRRIAIAQPGETVVEVPISPA